MNKEPNVFQLSVFKVLYENLPDGCVIVNANGSIVNFNPMMEEMFGYSREELFGKPVEILMSQKKSAQHVRDRMAFYKQPQKRQMGKRGIDLFACKKNGSLFPVDICLSPIYIEGELYVLTVIRDITENFGLKKQLLRSNELWNALLAESDDIISVLNKEGKILMLNRVPGYFIKKDISVESITGHPGIEFLHLDSAFVFRKKFRNVVSGKGVEQFEVKDESENWYEVSLIPVIREGEVQEVILTAKLITERKRAEEERIHTHREKIMAIIETQENERSRISYDLHDGLGQVLVSLNMFVLSLEEHLGTQNNETRKIFETVKELTQRSIKECRAISHNLQPKNLMEGGLVPALREMIRNIPHIQDNVKIRLHISESFCSQRFSKEKEIAMYRVLQEIIHNTIKHAFAGYLNIAITTDEKSIFIQTRDDGKGIPPEILQQGGGIGLAGIRKRIDDIHGSMEIDTAPGIGTRFMISIPSH